jgi:NADH-quinone oxidoreductase subunit M
MNSLLSLVTFLPMIGAVVLTLFLRGEDAMAQRNAKLLALFTTTATFILSLFVLASFDPGNPGFQFVEDRPWLGGLNYKMGVDGISVLFVMLTTFLMPLCIAASWNVEVRVKEYLIAFLLLETLMLGVVCALDLVLFYIFFEGGLIPMFLIIGIWGGKERIYASFKFFLYTFLGSVLMLVAMIAMYRIAGTTDIEELLAYPFQEIYHRGFQRHYQSDGPCDDQCPAVGIVGGQGLGGYLTEGHDGHGHDQGSDQDRRFAAAQQGNRYGGAKGRSKDNKGVFG